MSDIRSKIGVGFLKRRPSQDMEGTAQSSRADEFISEAIVLFTTRILRALASAGDHGAHVFDIAKNEKIQIGDALKVIEYLKSEGYAEVLESDEIGDDRIAATSAGRRFLQKAGS